MADNNRTSVGELKAWLSKFPDDKIVLVDEDMIQVVVDRYDYSGGATETLSIDSSGITDADK